MRRSPPLYGLIQKGTRMNSSLMSSGNSAAYYQESDIDKSPSDQGQKQSRLNHHQNSNQSSNQTSLLYQALFLPDKNYGGTNKKGNGVGSGNFVNRAPIRLSSTSTRRSSSLLDGGIAEQKECQSLSKDQLVNHSPRNFPGDSMSRSWTLSSTSLMSDGNPRLQQFGSTETFSPMANEVEQPCFEDLCRDDNEESLDGSNLVSTLPYNDVIQACSPSSVFQVLNNQCFEAAISEGTQLSTNEKYVTKMKQSKSSSPVSKGVYQSSILGNYLRQGQSDKSNSRHHHHHHKHHSRRKVVDKSVANLQDKSLSSDFVIPSPLSVSSVESSSSSGASDNKGQKKYRYNQTFSALQQSGLLKTTMRTAELLRQSRGLQQELAKLRRETSLFVECVLNNPQNKHLKEQRELNKEQCQAR